MQEQAAIETRLENGVLEVVLARPDRLNALDQQVAEELLDAVERGAARDDARALLLRGEGRAFSAGGNVKLMAGALDRDPTEFFDEPLGKIHDAALALARSRLPVVCAVQGFASGAAFNLVLACDFVVCAEGTRFNQAFVHLGLVPDTGGTFFLPRLIGSRRAAELLLLGDFVDAERALALGLVNRVVPEARLVETARELAARLAAGPTRAYAETKRLILDAAGATLAETLDAERRAQLRVGSSEDFVEGVRAFVEKREPRFRGR